MMIFEYPAGSTPLDPDEIDGLKPSHISTQNQLNEWEANNILNAEKWLASKSQYKNLLTLEFIKKVHKKMFDKTWKWAGIFRNSEKNIGTIPNEIPTKLKILLDDIAYQLQNQSYSNREIAYRFHHRLVSIHPFPNGNGRHARFMTDILLISMREERFSWGSSSLVKNNDTRKVYLNALRKADKGDYSELSAFVDS